MPLNNEKLIFAKDPHKYWQRSIVQSFMFECPIAREELNRTHLRTERTLLYRINWLAPRVLPGRATGQLFQVSNINSAGYNQIVFKIIGNRLVSMRTLSQCPVISIVVRLLLIRRGSRNSLSFYNICLLFQISVEHKVGNGRRNSFLLR